MKKILLSVLAIAIVFATIGTLSAGSTNAGPYLSLMPQSSTQVVNGDVTFLGDTKIGVELCDSVTSTNTAMKVVAFTATALAGIAVITFAPEPFTSKTTYYVIANEIGTTTTARAVVTTNNTGVSCTVYTDGLTSVVKGLAVGY